MKSKNKFGTLEVKLTAIENKFDAVQAELQKAIKKVEDKPAEAIEISKQNRDELESLSFRLAEQDRKLADQDSEIRRLLDNIVDLKNWSFRKTLIFKNIPYNSSPRHSASAIEEPSYFIIYDSKILPQALLKM